MPHERLERHIVGPVNPFRRVSYVDWQCHHRVPFLQTVHVNRDACALEQQAERIRENLSPLHQHFCRTILFSHIPSKCL